MERITFTLRGGSGGEWYSSITYKLKIPINLWLVSQAVKMLVSHTSDAGSTPARVTTGKVALFWIRVKSLAVSLEKLPFISTISSAG